MFVLYILNIVRVHSLSVTSSPNQQSTTAQLSQQSPFLFALKAHVPGETVSEAHTCTQKERKSERQTERAILSITDREGERKRE